jgi:hypothetical protein
MKQNPARIDSQKTAMGAESSFSLTRQAQTNHYDRRIRDKPCRQSNLGIARIAAQQPGPVAPHATSSSQQAAASHGLLAGAHGSPLLQQALLSEMAEQAVGSNGVGDPDLDPCGERARVALPELRSTLASAGVGESELAAALPLGGDDFTLLRFLVAREFDVSAAAGMVQARIKWAAEVGLSELMREWCGGPGGAPVSARAKAASEIFYAVRHTT